MFFSTIQDTFGYCRAVYEAAECGASFEILWVMNGYTDDGGPMVCKKLRTKAEQEKAFYVDLV